MPHSPETLAQALWQQADAVSRRAWSLTERSDERVVETVSFGWWITYQAACEVLKHKVPKGQQHPAAQMLQFIFFKHLARLSGGSGELKDIAVLKSSQAEADAINGRYLAAYSKDFHDPANSDCWVNVASTFLSQARVESDKVKLRLLGSFASSEFNRIKDFVRAT